MTVLSRPYNRPEDFPRVSQFLTDTYRPGIFHENWLQARWEYMHFHPWFDEDSSPKIGVWENDGKIVALVNYELTPGDAYFQVDPDFVYLKPEMLEYAEGNLRVKNVNGQKKLTLWIPEFDVEFITIIRSRGYQQIENHRDCWSVMNIPDAFPPFKLREGFNLQSLNDENDLYKLSRLLHRGFNHPGEPLADAVAEQRKMQSAPNFRKDLNIVVVAGNGAYAAYCGMWQDLVNKVAYIEPVCTDPDYRRLGLGRAAVLEGIKRCGEEGTATAMVGSEQPFYLSMGFQKLFSINPWMKNWQELS